LFFYSRKHKKNKEAIRNKEKNMKKMKREKERRTKDSLILSHVNLNFLLIGPSAFTHTHSTLLKKEI